MNDPNQKVPNKTAPSQGTDKKDVLSHGVNKPGEEQPIQKQGQDRQEGNERSPDSDKNKSDRRS